MKKFFHILRRAWQMGLATAIVLLYYRCKKRLFIRYWRGRKHVFAPLQAPSTSSPITVSILGFGTHTFPSSSAITWHQDLFVATSPAAWRTAFFADITIPVNYALNLTTTRQADIKVPWELSRLHLLHDVDAATLLAILDAWMQHNPFPYGVNWYNPMEVAIRAINIILAVNKHRTALTAQQEKSIRQLLALHAQFIEHCWEVSDRPNNHYLADLVGYLYLCCYLDIKKYYRSRYRAWRWLQHAFKHQILADGTSYEGSTAYHRLDAQLLYLALICAQKHGLRIDSWWYDLQARMHQFIADCSDAPGTLVTIGDDDGGSIVPEPLSPAPAPSLQSTATYRDFGLSIVRHAGAHFTFRHPAYRGHQPSGHFHHDWLAITYSVDGIPVFIDPGSYLYTAHPLWRNQQRSAAAHCTFLPSTAIAIPAQLDLFQLNMPPKESTGRVETTAERVVVRDAYQHGSATLSRTCTITRKGLVVQDYAVSAEQQAISWFLHLGPSITAQRIEKRTWLLLHKQQPLVRLDSIVFLHEQPGIASATYGAAQPTTRLVGSAQTEQGNKVMQQITATLVRH